MPGNVTAICPGTFDPVTVGHLDIIRRGADKFGRVVVGLIEIPQRKSPLFSPDDREAFLREALSGYDNVVVDPFNELVVEFAKRWEARVILKGLRAISDFEYEFAMASLNRKLAPDIETVFMWPRPSMASSARAASERSPRSEAPWKTWCLRASLAAWRRSIRCAAAEATQGGLLSMDVLVLIDKLDDILDQMRSTIPEEIKQARWIVKERQEMLAEAKQEAERVVGEAQERADD